MRVYIAGPMTGKPAYNAVQFHKAEQTLTEMGHDAHTPFEANSRVWMRHFGRPFDPLHDKCDYGDAILSEMIVEDLNELRNSDAIALLPGWQSSKGTRGEILMALTFGKKIYDAMTMEELHLDAAVVVTAQYSQTHQGVIG